jgi:hypothetical protein
MKPFSPLPEDPRLRVLSLGAGVQSTTLALMAAHGEFDVMPDCAIFADTGAEPQAVYEHLDWLRGGNVLPFPVHVVSAGSLKDELLSAARHEGNSWGRPPFFVRNGDGSAGMLRRQCTADYKIDPINRKVRELIGLKPRQRWPGEPAIEQWIGISLDELIRIKPPRQKAIAGRWPLIEKEMTRWDCKRWLERHEYPIPPKSACTFCPFHSDAMWRDIKLADPEAWSEAVAVDEAIRDGMAGVKAENVYVHRSLVPLAEIDFRNLDDLGQIDAFANECEGMCGV